MKVRTDGETRRLVAARLRDLMCEDPDIWLDTLCYIAVRDCAIVDDSFTPGEAIARLIDPVATWRNDGGSLTPWRCAACGCERSAVPNYCPNCGARVVSGHE